MNLRFLMHLTLRRLCLLAALVGLPPGQLDAGVPDPKAVLLLVTGAGGTDEYSEVFQSASSRWAASATAGGLEVLKIGAESEPLNEPDPQSSSAGPDAASGIGAPAESSAADDPSDYERLQQTLQALPRDAAQPLWIVLIGHGTFDGRVAKFNLRGADVSASELKQWLEPFTRPLVIVNCASSSAPFLNALSGPERIVITATRSGYEQNFARFGQFLAEAVADRSVDLDKDEQTSILEAFLWASKRVQEFYESETRLATEHALLDDNGDQLGTPADFFQGVRATQAASDGKDVDGLRANQVSLVPGSRFSALEPEQRDQLDALELELIRLTQRRAEFDDENAYFAAFETKALELARKYQELGLFAAEPGSAR